jgi:hypothetical protein
MNLLIMNWLLLVLQLMYEYTYTIIFLKLRIIVFFSINFSCSKSDDDLQKDFAKFGYKLNMIIDFFKSFSIFGYLFDPCIQI